MNSTRRLILPGERNCAKGRAAAGETWRRSSSIRCRLMRLISNGWPRKFKFDYADPLSVQTEQVREAILEALEAGMRGEIPEKGPRGGKIWPLRFYLRRVIWHTLDHAWEIEDRIV